ncbi:MAG: undecaprenyl-phosphate glucose phosphotransferase [Hyphomicrobium sp.]|nr:undecaprenyl-phosphate glucose phosphotransferase [Hyphomicrobium sp.]
MHVMSPVSMPPAAVRAVPANTQRSPLLQHLVRLFVDRRMSVSRPKVLFTVAFFDGVSIVLSSMAAAWLLAASDAGSMMALVRAALVAVLTISALHVKWSYSISALRSASGQLGKVFIALLTVFLTLTGAAYMAGRVAPSPDFVVVWLVLSFACLGLIRVAAAGVVRALTEAGMLVRKTIIVGGGKEADDVIAALHRDGAAQLQILGVFDDRADERVSESTAALARLGTFEDLENFCRDQAVDLLIVTVPTRAEDRLLQILNKLFVLQVDIRISALNARLRLNSNAYNYIGKVPMLAVMDRPLTDWDRALKNLEDRVLGALLLLLVTPIMAIAALAIRLDSKGPIFFKQKRYGFNNELIEVFKFRSMYTDLADATASKLVTRDDPRVTPVGRFIRRTSIDELPQLFNVILGNMSLVGPRPHATQAKAGQDLYQDVVQGYYARHRVKPGVTGWAQINGWRGETDTHDKIQSRVEYDLYYIDNWSVLLDLYVIALTPFSLLSAKNAY